MAFIILTLYIFISYTKIPQKWLQSVSVVSLMQVAAGLFVLLVGSSSVSSLLKLLYLQPIMFCVDSGNLEEKKKFICEMKYVICRYSQQNVLRNKYNVSAWRTCFYESSLNHVMKLWSQTVWRSLVCEPSVLFGTDHHLQNSELCKACLPLQETTEMIHERYMRVNKNQS